MSNELANILGNGNLVELGLDEDTLAVAGGATKGNVRISIDGRVFRKFVGGKEISVNTDNNMNVIFVKMAHTPSRTFYNSVYKKGVRVSPACWSNDSKNPDPEVKNPVAGEEDLLKNLEGHGWRMCRRWFASFCRSIFCWKIAFHNYNSKE